MSCRFRLLLALSLTGSPAAAQVLEVGNLGTERIRALDRARTVVLLPGAVLEEHGPYLPALTDGILSERLTRELARGIAARPGWTVLVFPQISVGASGSNELGGQFVFPGTYAVRPSTLRAGFGARGGSASLVAGPLSASGLRRPVIGGAHEALARCSGEAPPAG
jgi:creatinine amidohydrolase